MDGSVNGSVSGQMNFGGDGSVVTVTTKQHTGVNIVDIVVDGTTYHVYAPEPNSITISDLLTEGTKIGRITINNVNYDIYAPTGGGGSDVSVIPLLSQGTEIASITVDGNTAHIFAPTPDTVSASAEYNTGILVGSINISGNITYFYIPDYGADITALDNRLDTAEDNITSLTGRVGTAEDNITSLTGRVGTAEGNITSLTGRVGTAEGNITSLTGRVGTAEGNITNLAGRMTEAETDITALGIECDAIASDLAAPYDDESTYSVGEYCTYNKVLYQCNTDISTTEEWDSTHWDVVKVTDDISEIKSSLSELGFDYSNFRCFVTRPITFNLFIAIIPCNTPLPTSVTVNSFDFWVNGWTSLTLDSASIFGSSIVLQFNLPSGVNIDYGLNYWARGNMTLNYT